MIRFVTGSDKKRNDNSEKVRRDVNNACGVCVCVCILKGDRLLFLFQIKGSWEEEMDSRCVKDKAKKSSKIKFFLQDEFKLT